jgi:hypothetical protein
LQKNQFGDCLHASQSVVPALELHAMILQHYPTKGQQGTSGANGQASSEA